MNSKISIHKNSLCPYDIELSVVGTFFNNYLSFEFMFCFEDIFKQIKPQIDSKLQPGMNNSQRALFSTDQMSPSLLANLCLPSEN